MEIFCCKKENLSRDNPSQHETIDVNGISLENSYFNPANPTIILAHGWNSEGFSVILPDDTIN